MNKFNFKLENVLSIRKQFEDKAKNELSQEIKKLNEKTNRLQTEIKTKKQCLNTIKNAQKGSLDIHSIKNYNSYVNFLNSEIKNLNEAVTEQKTLVDKNRMKLLEASKKKKILEKLKEKKLINFLEKQRKEEDRITDEITSYKFFNI